LPHNWKPLVQADRGVFEDGSDLQAELLTVVLFVALEHSGIRKVGDVLRTATGTLDLTVRPAKNHHEAMAVFVILKVGYGFQKGCGEDVFAVHILTLQ
jgi:hypothetical protein